MSRYDIASEPSAQVIAENYHEVQRRIREAVAESTPAGSAERVVKLIAVSKTKSPACLRALYDCGHRDFGENYVQEVVEKAALLPSDIRWHFIGHLQSNKVKELLSGVCGLQLVQTVDSTSLATKLDSGCLSYRDGRPLEVYVQVNTSGEATKSGVEPGDATVELCRHIASKCENLRLTGLMTIGMPDYTSRPENFECLLQCREEVAAALGLDASALALSMGMSGDYTNAIRMGSTVVRVGTGLFGQRYYPPKDTAARTTHPAVLPKLMPCTTVTVVFDLRYADWELFDSCREVFIATVGDLFALALATVPKGQTQTLRVVATSGASLSLIYDSARGHASTGEIGGNVTDSVRRCLTELTPVRAPPRDTDRRVVDVLRQQRRSDSSGELRHHSTIFFTTFTSIGEFSHLVHSAISGAPPFMNDRWVSVHVDATAFTTTSLALTSTTRSIRCPIAPTCVRAALQRALVIPLSAVLPHVQVSLRYGRYTVPCVAHRTYLTIPNRCCTVEDLDATLNIKELDSLVLCGGRVCSSSYECERETRREVILTASGIARAEAIDDAQLYGDAWLLRGCEPLGGPTRSPGEWLHHLATELRGDVLLLRTPQPLLGPPHQLALPSSLFVGFFTRPDEMYLRAVIPPELRVERVDSVAPCSPSSDGGGRLDPTLAAELRKTTEALRGSCAEVELRQSAGVCRRLSQLRPNSSLRLCLTEATQAEGVTRRTPAQLFHSHRR